MKSLRKYISEPNLCIFLAVVAIIFFRLWRAPEFFSFNFDEEYQASLAWSIAKDFHVIWIGVSASNIGYYLGPGFTYLNAFLFWISKGDPISLAFFSPILGLLTTFSLYYVAKDLFTKKVGIYAMILYGGSTLLNWYDRRFWNPTPIPFISLWMVYSIIKAQKDTRWLILSSLLFASSFHVHLSLMIFIPLILFVVIKKFRSISPKTWILMVGVYIIITSPLIVFDVVHNFDNIRAPFKIFSKSETPLSTLGFDSFMSHEKVFLSSLGRIWFINPHTNIQNEFNLGAHGLISQGNLILTLISLIVLFWFFKETITKKNVSYIFISLAVILLIIGFLFYPGYAAEYYLLGFFVIFPIVMGVFLEKLLPEKIIYLILTAFLIVNAYSIFTSTQEKYGLLTRKKLIKKTVKYLGSSSYVLETYGADPRKYHPYGGWRYLFKTYGKAPNQSFADEFFGWIYPDEIKNNPSTLKVVVMEEKDYKTDVKPLAVFSEGAFKAYVFKNK